MDSLVDVRVADLLTFLAVQRTGSITSAAREMRVTPSQVSKAIARLERHSGVRLLARSTRGISLTEAGRGMVGRVLAAIAALRALRNAPQTSDHLELTLAGPSYLVTHVMPTVAMSHPRLHLRSLELAPAYMRAYVTENVYDIALIIGDLQGRPSTWTIDDVGVIRAALLAPPSIAAKLAPFPTTLDRVRQLPFVVPTVAPSDRFVPLDDACPLRRDERIVGHETQTIGAALEFAAQTDHVVFGPVIAARRLIEENVLVEVPVEGWNVAETLNVVCNGNRVLANVRKSVLRAIRDALPKLVP
ncbi:MAG TPA: LysR family transcriptional regulator [Polyangiaceae bacterium]|nr:LysR family transcriptional regulator [Polyangiaceae bacterium]